MSDKENDTPVLKQLALDPVLAARAEEIVTGSVKLFASLQRMMPAGFVDIADLMSEAMDRVDLKFTREELLALHLSAAVKLLAQR